MAGFRNLILGPQKPEPVAQAKDQPQPVNEADQMADKPSRPGALAEAIERVVRLPQE